MPDRSAHAAEPAFEAIRLSRVEARLVAHDWAWARDNARAIAAGWQARTARQPRLFDGRVLLARACTIRDGVAQVELFEVGFSQFAAYRAAGFTDGTGVANAFAALVPRTRDGAVLLGVMGAHTANAGQAYFPCGTPDLGDVRAGGRVDLAGSAEREFAEETGLALPAGVEDGAEGDWTLMRGEGQLAFLRPVDLRESAQALVARVQAHNAREAEPELAGLVAVRALADIDPARMPGFVQAYLRNAFAA